MRPAGPAPSVAGSPHLRDLVAEVERLRDALAGASQEARRRLAVDRAHATCRATLVLEGADVSRLPTVEQARDAVAAAAAEAPTAAAAGAAGDTPAPPDARPGTWLDALGFATEAPDELVQAFEVLGIDAGYASDDLAGPLLRDPLPALAELHRRLTHGVVDAEHAGTLRRTDQAVHDASIGRLIYHPTQPAAIAEEMARLAGWLVEAAATTDGLVISGVLHHELLRIHPYEAANGRVARTAARLVLRGHGYDPDGLAAPELQLARDPLDYHEEVARSLRRRDLTLWVERWAEAVSDGLRQAVRELGALELARSDRAAAFLASHAGDAFTVVDYRGATDTSPQATQTDLQGLLDDGLVRRVPGTRGLRFEVVGPEMVGPEMVGPEVVPPEVVPPEVVPPGAGPT